MYTYFLNKIHIYVYVYVYIYFLEKKLHNRPEQQLL